MRLVPLPISGAFAVEVDRLQDSRGFFGRTFCQREFTDAGLVPVVAQCNVSWNERKGTLRGLHFQTAPHQEVKLVRCTSGTAWDVLVDLRPDSPSWLRWTAVEISSTNRTAVYVPAGCAHGFQTLVDGTELLYQMSEFYQPQAASGVRWNDPAFGITWPVSPIVVSDRDNAYPDFRP